MVAAAVTGGDVYIKDCITDHNRPLMSKLREMGVEFIEDEGGLRVIGPDKLKPTDVKTMPHPGYPTDLQAPMTIAQLMAPGQSIMRETVFENRFMHMEELRKMNADFKIDDQSAIIFGGRQLQGARVQSSDLRASSTLVIAGLVANGITRVTNLKHLDRGYYNFTEKLQALGANIERINDEGASEKEATKESIQVS